MSKLLIAVVLFLVAAVVGCEPTERTHARTLGGQLRYLYQQWSKEGRPASFQLTNYITSISDTNSTPDRFIVFTNTVSTEGSVYHCRFAVRSSPGGRFWKPGVLAISDEGVLLWIADDGKIVVAPDTKEWSSK